MKKYNYQARDHATNKVVKSVVQADSENAAAKLLIEQGFIPLQIREQGINNNPIAKFLNRITTSDKIVFTRQLATLVGAGLPLSQSLSTALGQTQNKKLQQVIQEILASVEGGKSLSDSFAKFPQIFDPVFLSIIGAGETSGTLDEALQRIAAQQEKDAAIVSKIKGALTYPAIVLVVIFAVMGFMLFTVVPQVEKLYKDLKLPLPTLTQFMVNTADFISSYWYVVIIIIGLIIFFASRYVKTDNGRQVADNLKIKIPIFGAMFRKLYMGRLMRTGQTLLSTGVSMLDMLRITSKAVNNSVVEKSILRVMEKVKGGKALSASLQAEDVILSLVPQMIKIGEQSGKIDEMMGKTAKVYEDQLDEQIATISTAIEPILMVALAAVAGGMVAAILMPIYQLVNNINV